MNILKEVKIIYTLLFWMLMPLIVAMLPIIPAVLFNDWYALFMILTYPFSIVLFNYSVKKIMEQFPTT